MIAFLGTGLVGSGFVRAMLRRGEEVQVYNRTHEKAAALEAAGARAFADPRLAASGATRVHLALSDDAAVDDVLERALGEAGPTADRPLVRTLVIDHTTTSPSRTAARIERLGARGVRLVHAPIFMGPQNALESTGLMLVSGARALVEEAKPHLGPMTGKVVDLGDRPDAAAAFKLLGNLHLMFLTSGLADLFTLAGAMSVAPRDAASLFEHFNPGLSLGARVERMLGKPWDAPSWELAMARKDARLMLDEAAGAGRALEVLPAIAARMDALIAEGHGAQDWTVLARDALT